MTFLNRFFSKLKRTQQPHTVILETTNACNLHCKMCHVHGNEVDKNRETGFMPETIWLKALDEIALWDKPINVVLHGAGEPLLHKDFFKILRYACSKPNINAGFLSNGTLLTNDIAQDIIDTGVSWIGFSVDGAEPEKYNYYRGSNLFNTESNIENLLSIRKGHRPRIFVNMVALADINIPKFIDRWIDKVEEIKVSKYRPVGKRDFLDKKIKRLPCYLLDEMLVIAWNGKVVLCCEDIWAEEIIGEFPEKSLQDIWDSKKLNKIRMLHKKEKAYMIPLCKDCDGWSNVLTETIIDNDKNIKKTVSPSQISYSRLKKCI